MAVKVLRRTKAANDVEEIANYLAADSFEAALRFIESTEATVRYLADSSSIGSPFKSDHSDLANMRYCRVHGFPNHVIFYIEHSTTIEVIRVLHGARDIDAELHSTDR